MMVVVLLYLSCRWRLPDGDYRTAIGLTGDPTAPVMGRGAAVSRKSYLPSAAQASARPSGSHISPRTSPRLGMAIWGSGWKAASNSLGRTSKPQVSVAIPAISLLCSQGAALNDNPGAD